MNFKKIIKNVMPYGFVIRKQNEAERRRKKIQEPFIYNKRGERMRVFFLKDSICTHSPYTFSSQNLGKTESIFWDRYNSNLPIHFYTHKDIFEERGSYQKKFALLLESEAIVPDEYEKVLRESEHMKSFVGIFTHSQRLLEKYDNAYFIPGSSVWYGGSAGGGRMCSDAYLMKCKDISLVSSDKAQCELHKYRLRLANWLFESKKVDVLGTFNGGQYVNIADSLCDYRYSIVIENYISNCYFTEKILNCFASMTVPIYIGAMRIGDYFNEDGIIQIDPSMSEKEILQVIDNCSDSDYRNRLDAIKENYERVQDYLCIEDYIYNHYRELFDI